MMNYFDLIKKFFLYIKHRNWDIIFQTSIIFFPKRPCFHKELSIAHVSIRNTNDKTSFLEKSWFYFVLFFGRFCFIYVLNMNIWLLLVIGIVYFINQYKQWSDINCWATHLFLFFRLVFCDSSWKFLFSYGLVSRLWLCNELFIMCTDMHVQMKCDEIANTGHPTTDPV